MLCVYPPINVSNSLIERSDLQDSDVDTETTSDTARLTVHEDEVEFYWPLAYSTCYPVWQAACVLNTPFYAYPLKLWADPNYVAQRELALLAATIFGEDTRRSSEMTTPNALEPAGGEPKAQVHIPKDEMVLASKSLMELDATCDKRVGAQLQGIGKKRGTKVLERVKTKLSLLTNFEQKIRKKRPVVEKTKSESTESFTEAPIQEAYFTDDEMNSALLLLDHQFGSSNKTALRVAEALNRGKVALRKLRVYLGEEGAAAFLRTITKPRWLMTLLSNALGSMKSALKCIDIYRRSEVGSSEYKDVTARLVEVAGNENFIKAFVQKFGALRETVANRLMEQLKMSADEVDQIIVGCLSGANIPMRRIEGLTGANAEVIQGLLNAVKHCDEEEVETYVEVLVDCIAGKLKTDEETAERLARIQKHQSELEQQIQKHQQGLQESRHGRKSAIIITMPTEEQQQQQQQQQQPQPLYSVEARPPETSPARQDKRKGKKKGLKGAAKDERVKREVRKESKQMAPMMRMQEAKKAAEVVEEEMMGEDEMTLPSFESTVLDDLSSQVNSSDEFPHRSRSMTVGSLLSMEVGLMSPSCETPELVKLHIGINKCLAMSLGVDLPEQTSLELQQLVAGRTEEAKLGPSEVPVTTDELINLPLEAYIVDEEPGNISDILHPEDLRLIDARLSKRVWELENAVECEGFLEPDIGLEPNRIVLVLLRSAISATTAQLLEMINHVNTLLKHFVIVENVKETVRYMWDLLFRKIAAELRSGEYEAGEKTIYLEAGRRIIKQLKQLGVNTYHYVSYLEASVMRKSVSDAMAVHKDLFPGTSVVPNIDLGELLKAVEEGSLKRLSSLKETTPTFHFAIKEAVEETESTYSTATLYTSERKNKSPSPSPTASIAVSMELTETEKQPTFTEEELSSESSDSEMVWSPSRTAAGRQLVDVESFEDVTEDVLAKRLFEAYGGEMQTTRPSLIKMAREMVENSMIFDAAELRSLQSTDLENVDEAELELAVAKVMQKLEDEEAAAKLLRVATPEIEEVETLEMRMARARTLLAQRRTRTTEEESSKEVEPVSLTPPLPPYHADVVKHQLQNIIEELELSRRSQQDLNTLERILWLTLPENVADRYELFVRVADLQRYNFKAKHSPSRRGQFSTEALKSLLESILVDVTDLLTLLDPEFEIEDEQRYTIYDQLRTNLDVLCWFQLDIDGYEEQLQSYLRYIPQSLAKFVDAETPQPWHKVTIQGTEADKSVGNVDSEEEFAEMPNEAIHFAPLADSLTEEIKERMHDRNFEGELFSELSPTQKQANKLVAYMNWRRKKIEMTGTTARCLFSIAPEIVNQDRNIFLEVIKLVDVQALSAEGATLFVSSTLQDLLDLMLIVLNKDDFQKDERQMAYNQCRAMMEVLQCFKVPIKEIKSNFDEIFVDGNFPTISDDCAIEKNSKICNFVHTKVTFDGIACQVLDDLVYCHLDFFVDLPQACVHELPYEVLDGIGGRLRIEETEREPLKSYLKHIDEQAFVDQDRYDFERTRALAVHALRLHPQDVNEIVKGQIEVHALEEQKRRLQEESKARAESVPEFEKIIDRWLSEVVQPTAIPSAKVLPQETGVEMRQQKETLAPGHPAPGEGSLEEKKPQMKKEFTTPITPKQKMEGWMQFITENEPIALKNRLKFDCLSSNPHYLNYCLLTFYSYPIPFFKKDVLKLLEKNEKLEIQREKFARHLAAVEAAKKKVSLIPRNWLKGQKIPMRRITHPVLFQLSVIYERLGDVSATAKRKAYDQTSKLRKEEEQHSRKKLKSQEGEETFIAPTKSTRTKESLKRVSRIAKARKDKTLIKKKSEVKSTPREQLSLLPSSHLPPLELKMATMVREILPPVIHKFAEIESIYSVSPLSPPPPSPPHSGRTRLPPLWQDQQIRWRNIFLRENQFNEVNIPKVEVIKPIDMTIKNIQPLKSVRARKHCVEERVNHVARVTEPATTMTSETLKSISVEDGLPKRMAHWFNRISRKETMRRKNIILSSLSRSVWQEIPDLQAAIRFPRPSMITSEGKESAEVGEQLQELSWLPVSHVEANHRFITDELRINLILKRLRMQLDTHDLVEVMIDLHTGRASKKTKEIVENIYTTIKDQKYTHLSDEAAEKCRPQCRPSDLSSVEWKRIGADVRSAHPSDEHSFPGYFTADSIGDGKRAHCEQEKMAELGSFRTDLTFSRVNRRANIIGRVRTYVQERCKFSYNPRPKHRFLFLTK
ncbi:unnamed protein product [Hydatigera taeniaeformis]|uniref:SAP domain-containing protein n=1 Tax=Hydatigena taeniaeformis TaxID=6205 RepID=A0A158RDD8_HYDTA|nr:unnamed protein product [Hydatigera taeniaeformis]